MKLYHGIESIDRLPENTVITIGSFDGVHLGHMELLRKVHDIAKQGDRQSLIITFNPHPQTVLQEVESNFLITSIEERIELIDRTGLIDNLLVLKFDKSFSELEPKDFIDTIIMGMVKPSHIVMGYDAHFGKDRMGDIIYLKNITQRRNITVDIVEPFIMSEEPVSSTMIRKFLRFGKIKEANRILGYDYFIKGHVVKGEGRGALLGFPTANIELFDEIKILPQNGVYAVTVGYNGEKHRGIMNIGSRPTFEDGDMTIEVHILDLSENLYGSLLKIHFIDRIRDEVKFEDNEKLIEQLKIDIEKQKEIQGG
ncbi:MAG: bifunctional riboflavin kinase/FAD synthetase [bacterium]